MNQRQTINNPCSNSSNFKTFEYLKPVTRNSMNTESKNNVENVHEVTKEMMKYKPAKSKRVSKYQKNLNTFLKFQNKVNRTTCAYKASKGT